MTKLILISFAIVLTTVMTTIATHAQEPTSTTDPQTGVIEAEAGAIISDGNTRASSYLAKAGTAYRFNQYLGKLSGLYLRNDVRDSDTGVRSDFERWNAGLRFERDLGDRFGIFLGQSAEADKKSGIDRRYNSDIGGRIYLARAEGYYTFGELGYRYMMEEYVAGGNEDFNLARAYLETYMNWNPTWSTKLWAEYLPNVEDDKDYQLNGEASVAAALSTTFALKTAYLARYDNTPAAAEKTDTLFITSLIAKF